MAAVLLISKYYNDVFYSNKYIAFQIGMPLRLMNEIERSFSKFINYHVHVTEEHYDWYIAGLIKHTTAEQLKI